MVGEILRVIAVVVLLGAAAATATPKGRIPLALRGICRIMSGDRGESAGRSSASPVSVRRRLLALLQVAAAVALALAW